MFLTNGASQPHALFILSCPDCPVPGARVTPGKAQGQHTQQDTSQQVTWPLIPSGQILRQPVCVARTRWDGGCQQVRPGVLSRSTVGVQSSKNPRGLWATQLEPAGRKEGGVVVKVEKGHLGKWREEERESQRRVG